MKSGVSLIACAVGGAGLAAVAVPASAQLTAEQCQRAHQTIMDNMMSGSRKSTVAEMSWGLDWEKKKKAGEICNPIPETLMSPGDTKPDRKLQFDRFSAKHFVIENGNTVDIQPYDPARSDCYSAFAAIKFGQDMYGVSNFTGAEYVWLDEAKRTLDDGGYCPSMPEEIAEITTSYVERFGYHFAPRTGSPPSLRTCQEHKDAVYSTGASGEVRRWADTYLMAKLWKQPSYVQQVCNMLNSDLTDHSGSLVMQARDERRQREILSDQQYARDIANAPAPAPTLSEQLEDMSKAIVKEGEKNSRRTYRCYNNADGKTQTCGYVNR